MRNAPHHGLAIELEHESENSVSGRVLRPDVDEHVLTFKVRLDAGRWLESDGRSAIARHEGNTLGPALRVEPRGRKLYFDCALRHLLARPLALVQPLAHV